MHNNGRQSGQEHRDSLYLYFLLPFLNEISELTSPCPQSATGFVANQESLLQDWVQQNPTAQFDAPL